MSVRLLMIPLILLILCAGAQGIERFPPPDFETDYVQPTPTTPQPRHNAWEYVDTAVLIGALALGTYLILWKRYRGWVLGLGIFSLLYFGFFRMGCVCSIGAMQNVSMGLGSAGYIVPIVIILFFALPLLLSLFFGRIFCGAVCPLGAIQDIMVWKPVSVPQWLESGLRIIAYLYLSLAILFALTGSAFIICQYDPFISFFRLNGPIAMFSLGVIFLLLGLFVARPYCRFLCPLGMLLRNTSRLSHRRVKITPDECIHCRLCEDVCPFDAIRKPTGRWPDNTYIKDKKRFAFALLAWPILIIGVGFGFSKMDHFLSQANYKVKLAQEVHRQETGQVKDEEPSDELIAFRTSGQSQEELYTQTQQIQSQFAVGTWLIGGFLGLIIGGKLVGTSIRRTRTDYEADKASCLACGRCYQYCPVEQRRRNEIAEKKQKTE